MHLKHASHHSLFVAGAAILRRLGRNRQQNHSKRSNMLHIEPSADGNYLKLTYDIILKEGSTAEQMTQELGQVEGASEVVLIASKSDVDY